MRIKVLFISSLLIALVVPLAAQERCGTLQYEKLLALKNPQKEKKLEFENWINQKLKQSSKQLNQQRTGSATYEIPVVVHIIHNGEAIGSGTNLSDNQILSQINVLNKDFKRLNTDATNTPAEFQSAAGSLDIEFILAKQDPYGAPTTGIQRVQGTKSEWVLNDNATFKALSYWPAEDYYNIWVINIPSYLGYAQLPVSNLPGLENSPDDRLTDGTIIHYTAFGSNFEGLGTFNLLSDYNHGRTLTHETGHFFGLRHIWGDDGTSCSGTDYVDDTPNQAGNYSGQCPTHPRPSCSTNDMFMNYMDYTDDACMNMFTQGQFARAIVVLDNSPRRFSLRNSIGDEPPPPVANDLALRKIISPGVTSCGGSVIPNIEIQNLGTTPATSAQLQLKVNGIVVETRNEVLNLATLAITTLTFNPVVQLTGSANYEFNVLLVNGVTDQGPLNNYLYVSSMIPASGTLPITEVFNSFPTNWSQSNPDNNIPWAIKSTSSNGNAMYVNCYDYENQGAVDRLITPVLDLTNETVALLKFDRAHAMYSTENQERLRILISTVCDFDNAPSEVMNLLGPALATAPTSTNRFVPNASQWKTETISLNSFVGNKIQIAFEVTNGWGNDVYLDNVVVLTDELIDLALLSVVSPGPVTCQANPSPVIRVKNLGSTLITSFKVETRVNTQTQPLQTISNISLAPGAEQNFTLNPIQLTGTSSTLFITLSEPGGLPDANVNNNTLFRKSIYNNYQESIPLRQDFNEVYTDQWPVISQGNDAKWIPFATNKLYSLAYPAYSSVPVGDESWIVSPVLDFTSTNEARVFFDISYATQSQGDERLRILYSDDCGQTYPNVLYDKSGASLSTTNTSLSWIPTKEDDWERRSLNLNTLAGKENIRLAFVATSDSGNNLFIDNVEFFIDDDLSPIAINNQYEVYGVGTDVKLTFNLPEKESVLLKVYNTLGQKVLEDQLYDVLNQTYTFDMHQQGTGIYIIWVQFANQVGSSKVFLTGSN